MARNHRARSASTTSGSNPHSGGNSHLSSRTTRTRKQGNSQGRFPCSIPGCNAVANHLSSMCRHKWGHLPQYLLPTCRGHLPNGSPCPVRYQGRADTMKRHWLTHHVNEGPYIQDRYPPFEDLWRQVGEGEVVLSPPPFRQGQANLVSERSRQSSTTWIHHTSSPVSDSPEGEDSSDSDDNIPPHHHLIPEPASSYPSPHVADERQHFYDNGYTLPPMILPIPEISITMKEHDPSPIEGSSYMRAAISPLELSLISHPPADHLLYNKFAQARTP